MTNKTYDTIIIGAGPAGITAAIYAKRYNMEVALISKEFGGYMNEAPEIDNYPGFKQISGFELQTKTREHLEYLQVEIIDESAIQIEKSENLFIIKTESNHVYAKSIIYAIGTKRRKLNVPGEDKFQGRGVSYCATCDGAFFKNKAVAVIGGGDSAAKAAMMLAEHCSKVYVIVKAKEMIAEPKNQEIITANSKIQILTERDTKEIQGEKTVTKLITDKETLDVNGIFVEIGSYPDTKLLDNLDINKHKDGYILANELMETNIKGLFAAGDINKKPLKQIITACNDGAIAAYSAFGFVKKN